MVPPVLLVACRRAVLPPGAPAELRLRYERVGEELRGDVVARWVYALASQDRAVREQVVYFAPERLSVERTEPGVHAGSAVTFEAQPLAVSVDGRDYALSTVFVEREGDVIERIALDPTIAVGPTVHVTRVTAEEPVERPVAVGGASDLHVTRDDRACWITRVLLAQSVVSLQDMFGWTGDRWDEHVSGARATWDDVVDAETKRAGELDAVTVRIPVGTTVRLPLVHVWGTRFLEAAQAIDPVREQSGTFWNELAFLESLPQEFDRVVTDAEWDALLATASAVPLATEPMMDPDGTPVVTPIAGAPSFWVVAIRREKVDTDPFSLAAVVRVVATP
jgi:hypothetical protein